MKVTLLVGTHCCGCFGVFSVVRLVETSGNFAKNKNILLRYCAKIYKVYIQTSRNYKFVEYIINSGRFVCYCQSLAFSC